MRINHTKNHQKSQENRRNIKETNKINDIKWIDIFLGIQKNERKHTETHNKGIEINNDNNYSLIKTVILMANLYGMI